MKEKADMAFRTDTPIRRLFNQFVTGGTIDVPYHRISMIDSRMWDPKWRAVYGPSYNALTRNLFFGFGDIGRARTVASFESYRWGRDRRPAAVLKTFDNMTPQQVFDRLAMWLRRMARGNSAQDIIRNVLGGLADGPADQGPLQAIPEEAPSEGLI